MGRARPIGIRSAAWSCGGVTMRKLYDEMGIWKVYIQGKVMWTWQLDQ